jgi:hypothetical protein
MSFAFSMAVLSFFGDWRRAAASEARAGKRGLGARFSAEARDRFGGSRRGMFGFREPIAAASSRLAACRRSPGREIGGRSPP